MRDQVADFGLTVGVDQEVTRLEVTVNDASRVNVLETAEGVINKRLEMIVGEWLRDRSRQGALSDWWTPRGESNSQLHADRLPSAPPGRLEGDIRRRSEMRVGREDSRIDELRQNFHLARRPDSYRKDK